MGESNITSTKISSIVRDTAPNSQQNFDVTSPVMYMHPRELKPNPLNNQIYEDPEDADFDNSIKEKGILKPIIVNKQKLIIDGHRRWKRANRFGFDKVPVQIRHFDDEELALVLLNRYREKTFSEKMKEADIIEPKIKEQIKPGRPEIISANLHELSLEKQSERTDDIASSHVGMKPRTYVKARKVWKLKEEHPEIVEPELKAINEGKQSVDGALQKIEKQVNPEESKPKPFKPIPFTLWNFSKCDDRFGVADFPGRIPGQIVQNVLHYYTNEGDFIVDPMAGSGTTFDVCALMNRRCLCLDVDPIRSDIIKHDIREGFPDETRNCDLIFLDPPYFKKLAKKERYNHIGNRKEWLEFVQKLAKDCFEALHPKGIVALLISDYIDGEAPLLSCEYYNIFKDASFTPINRIQTPLTSQQYDKYDVKRAIDEKTMLNITRDLFIFRKV